MVSHFAKNFGCLLVAAVALAGCATSATVQLDDAAPASPTSLPVTPDADSDAPESVPAATAQPSQPAAPVGAATVTVTPPVAADDTLDLDDVTGATDTFALTLEEGSEWEMPLVVAVPQGWIFDQALPGFTDGSSSIALTAGCAGPCEVKSWNQALSADGEFFDQTSELFPGSDSVGVYGTSSGSDSTDSVAALVDEGHGVSRTAHTRNGAGRFFGCTATAAEGVSIDELRELCEAIEVDWFITLANTPAYVFTEVLSAEAAAVIANPAPGMARQTFFIEDDGAITIAVPTGAAVINDGSDIELADRASIFTDLGLDATCDGSCGPQDWDSKLQELNGSLGRTRLRLDVVDDSPIEDGWLVSGSEVDGDHTILVIRWNDDADRFFQCEASIDDRDADPETIDIMLNVCLSAQPDWTTW